MIQTDRRAAAVVRHPVNRRRTRQRDAVLRAVRTLGGHPDVRTVFERVRAEMPNISLATVYRNLGVLASLGYLSEVRPGDCGQVRFDNNLTHHGHLICRKCGMIEDVDLGVIEGRIRRAYRCSGYADLVVDLDIFGTCPACRRAASV